MDKFRNYISQLAITDEIAKDNVIGSLGDYLEFCWLQEQEYQEITDALIECFHSNPSQMCQESILDALIFSANRNLNLELLFEDLSSKMKEMNSDTLASAIYLIGEAKRNELIALVQEYKSYDDNEIRDAAIKIESELLNT